jgi:ribose/xylose/arabinose/galactoside ABC-type transport system permease subunit
MTHITTVLDLTTTGLTTTGLTTTALDLIHITIPTISPTSQVLATTTTGREIRATGKNKTTTLMNAVPVSPECVALAAYSSFACTDLIERNIIIKVVSY